MRAGAGMAGDQGVNFDIDLDAPDFDTGPLRFTRNHCQNGMVPRIIAAADGGKAIVLEVGRGKYALEWPYDLDDLNYERCELREAKEHPTKLGTHSFYGFSLRVPENFPKRELRCVIAQIKMPYEDTNLPSPCFALRIDNGQLVATIEHLYEFDDPVDHGYLSDPLASGICQTGAVLAQVHHNFDRDSPDYCLQMRALLATDATGLPPHLLAQDFTHCTSGVKIATRGFLPPADGRWSDFIVEIYPSGQKNVDGGLRLYVDGCLIALAQGEFGLPQASATGDFAQQYFKIGPYRNLADNWGLEPAGIEVRHLRRGSNLVEVLLAQPLVS